MSIRLWFEDKCENRDEGWRLDEERDDQGEDENKIDG